MFRKNDEIHNFEQMHHILEPWPIQLTHFTLVIVKM